MPGRWALEAGHSADIRENARVPRPSWWGSRAHIIFTIVVFVILASLDNAAVALIPAMVLPVTETLNTSEQAIGISTALVILIVALSAAGWGYFGDRSSRKRVLFWGTIVWAVGAFLTSTASAFAELLAFQIVTGLGLGSIASVGFSVISDFVSPHRRGLAMSFWGLSQGVGGLTGGLLGSQLGADDFRRPLVVIAVLGLAFAVLYLVTFDAPRGYSQPELAELRKAGLEYDYRIEPEHVPTLWHRETNRWLILQGLFAQVAYGSLIWVPLLYQEKVIEGGIRHRDCNKGRWHPRVDLPDRWLVLDPRRIHRRPATSEQQVGQGHRVERRHPRCHPVLHLVLLRAAEEPGRHTREPRPDS